MKTKKAIVTETDSIVFGWLDGEEFIEMNDGTREELLKRKDFRRKLLEALEFIVWDLRTHISTDLKDIWKRLDSLEKRIELITK
jgi:hypothetical protein